MFDDKELSSIVTELFLRGRKLNILLVFISKYYFKVLGATRLTIRLNATHYFIMKIPNKSEVRKIASYNSSDIGFKDFLKLSKDYTKEPYSSLVKDITLSYDNTLQFRKNIL